MSQPLKPDTHDQKLSWVGGWGWALVKEHLGITVKAPGSVSKQGKGAGKAHLVDLTFDLLEAKVGLALVSLAAC